VGNQGTFETLFHLQMEHSDFSLELDYDNFPPPSTPPPPSPPPPPLRDDNIHPNPLVDLNLDELANMAKLPKLQQSMLTGGNVHNMENVDTAQRALHK